MHGCKHARTHTHTHTLTHTRARAHAYTQHAQNTRTCMHTPTHTRARAQQVHNTQTTRIQHAHTRTRTCVRAKTHVHVPAPRGSATVDGAFGGRLAPHLRRDSPTSAPGLARICAGTRPASSLRRYALAANARDAEAQYSLGRFLAAGSACTASVRDAFFWSAPADLFVLMNDRSECYVARV